MNGRCECEFTTMPSNTDTTILITPLKMLLCLCCSVKGNHSHGTEMIIHADARIVELFVKILVVLQTNRILDSGDMDAHSSKAMRLTRLSSRLLVIEDR
ncbi:hypothetical protein TNCV_3455661 [Trichonephila clavipes]|nr:hypothetical protein TNCV_3455661 [Trichonephila clavipes]